MTTTENGQRDELIEDIAASLGGGNASVRAITNVAEALITKGYRKPRTITTVEGLAALPLGSVIRDGDEELMEKTDNGWCCWVYVEGFLSSELTLPAIVLYEPDAGVPA